ncbi:MAG: adenylyl-sulfate kinase [Planctomycetota bacterium]
MTDSSRNIVRHEGTITRQDREQLLGQRGCVAWFTGLSGSGKSTVSRAVEERLTKRGRLVYVLDGDNVRHGLCSDLGFSDSDRTENIRRVGHVAALLADTGAIVLTAFISPFRSDRAQVREVVGDNEFLEVFVDAPLDVCESRDPKGLYKKARDGKIPEFTGISSPYEAPEKPALVVPTGDLSLDACAEAVESMLAARGFLAAGSN